MSAPDSIRVGDRERAEAAERLSGHAAAGRLGVEELEERLDRAQRAVTVRDLRAVEADLPAPPEPRRPGAPWPWAPVAPLIAALLASVVLGVVLVGHPFPPLLLAAVLLWRLTRRTPAFTPRRTLR